MKKIILLVIVLIAVTFKSYPQCFDTVAVVPAAMEREMVNASLQFEPHVVEQAPKGEEYRHLFFIHGLGGSPEAWTKVPEACYNQDLNIPGFPARRCYVLRPDYTYSTQGTLSIAAADVLNQIKAQNVAYLPSGVSPGRGILIGHSQGGLVCRSLMHDYLSLPQPSYGDDYGGFISVASPLQGAMILNNRSKIIDLANDACSRLSAGPIESQGVIQRFFINKLLKTLVGDDYVNTICGAVVGGVQRLFFTKYYASITNSYTVGANSIHVYNGDVSNPRYKKMPKIAMYAVEPKEKIFWRTMEWMIKSPNHHEVDYFQANSDFSFYNDSVAPLYSTYRGNWQASVNRLKYLEENKNAMIGVAFLTFGATYIQYVKQVKKHEDLKDAWGKGKEWFEQVDSKWETIIGARTYETRNQTYYICLFCHPFFPLGFPIYSPVPELCQLYNCAVTIPQTTQVYVSVLSENDGVVTRASAENLPGATHAPIRVYPRESENVVNKGSSHMQIRNDEGIKQHLYKAFEGAYGDFFITNEK